MEAPTPSCSSQPQFSPNIESIKRTLLKKGVYPAPKTLHALRKKQIQKHKRKLKKTQQTPPLTASQKQLLDEESHFQTLKQEYKDFTKALNGKSGSGVLVGKPWERIEWVKLREIGSGCKEFSGERLKWENLRELMEVLESDLKWVLEDDVDTYEFRDFERNYLKWGNEVKQQRSERDAIQFLVNRLSKREVTVKDWKLAEMMKQAGLRFSEGQLLKILEGLSHRGKWKQAMAVVEWVYNAKQREDCKSRFVYTKLLSILGKERRPREALEVFNLMLEDCVIYPDMAAYHSIAVTLGQAGHLKELMKIIECMGKKPSKRIKNMLRKNWDPSLAPDLVIYNAVLNACILASQWKGVYWVFQQLRKNGIKPNGATYGLAMEVMLHSGKYELVYEFFRKMNKAGEAPKAVTYKVLVRSFWKEGKVIEAMKTVRDMEQRGVVGTASVYYELACCLCNKGRWQDAMMEVEKMKRLHLSKPLEVTFTGMILSSMDGRHINDCISIFEYMKAHCVPNIGTVNIMLKVYGRNGLFSKAKELFEEIKWNCAAEDVSLRPDEYTYSAMLETSASALQWDYFESVYKELAFDGYCLDQSKHALLLVEASRAGKGHLLEHAFDRILEAGEIPFPILFIEMVFQSTAREDYDRAVTLVNTMALGSLQVSQSQWTALLKKHKDRISQDGLEKLLDAICVSGMTSEVTVSNLLKSLQLLCHSGHNKGHTI